MSDAPNLAQPADVVMCYRLFLGREPENNAVIELHLNNNPTIRELIERFDDSQEHEPIGIDKAIPGIWRRQDGRGIRVDASPEHRNEILAHVEKIWSSYGTEDPYYSVLTDPAYKAENITDRLTEQFYDSGVAGVNDFNFVFERNRLLPDKRWHILELGCGVGRIGEHFCRDFEYYEGVDISANHLSHARARFADKNIANARFHLLQDVIAAEISFDIFYSLIVLQHNPPPIIYYLLDVFLGKLNPNGYAFFQLPCHLYGYTFDADSYVAGYGKYDSMEMHALPQKYVFELLYKHGLQPIEVCPYPAIGPIGLSYIFLAHKNGENGTDSPPGCTTLRQTLNLK